MYGKHSVRTNPIVDAALATVYRDDELAREEEAEDMVSVKESLLVQRIEVAGSDLGITN